MLVVRCAMCASFVEPENVHFSMCSCSVAPSLGERTHTSNARSRRCRRRRRHTKMRSRSLNFCVRRSAALVRLFVYVHSCKIIHLHSTTVTFICNHTLANITRALSGLGEEQSETLNHYDNDGNVSRARSSPRTWKCRLRFQFLHTQTSEHMHCWPGIDHISCMSRAPQ